MSAFIQFKSKTPQTILSLEDAKRQLKIEVEDDFDNPIIQDCIDAAIDEAESYINSSIYKRIYEVKCSAWLQDNYEISKQIITAVNSITYKPADGGEAVVIKDVAATETEAAVTALTDFIELLPTDKYVNILSYKDADNLPELITNKNDAVVINITVGYESKEVPKGLLQGIKLLMTENYHIRNNIESKNYRTTALRKLEPYKYYTNPIDR